MSNSRYVCNENCSSLIPGKEIIYQPMMATAAWMWYVIILYIDHSLVSYIIKINNVTLNAEMLAIVTTDLASSESVTEIQLLDFFSTLLI